MESDKVFEHEGKKLKRVRDESFPGCTGCYFTGEAGSCSGDGYECISSSTGESYIFLEISKEEQE